MKLLHQLRWVGHLSSGVCSYSRFQATRWRCRLPEYRPLQWNTVHFSSCAQLCKTSHPHNRESLVKEELVQVHNESGDLIGDMTLAKAREEAKRQNKRLIMMKGMKYDNQNMKSFKLVDLTLYRETQPEASPSSSAAKGKRLKQIKITKSTITEEDLQRQISKAKEFTLSGNEVKITISSKIRSGQGGEQAVVGEKLDTICGKFKAALSDAPCTYSEVKTNYENKIVLSLKVSPTGSTDDEDV